MSNHWPLDSGRLDSMSGQVRGDRNHRRQGDQVDRASNPSLFRIRIPSRKSLALMMFGAFAGGSGMKALSSDLARAILGLPHAEAEQGFMPMPVDFVRNDPSVVELRIKTEYLEKGLVRMEGKLDQALGLSPKTLSWADRDRGQAVEEARR